MITRRFEKAAIVGVSIAVRPLEAALATKRSGVIDRVMSQAPAKPSRRRVRLLVILGGVYVLGAVALAVFVFDLFHLRKPKKTACQLLNATPLDKVAPDFSLPNLDGKRHQLAEYRGKVVLLNFWATWCPPCVDEFPSLVVLHSEMKKKNRDFVVLMVSVDDSPKDVTNFLKKEKWTSHPLEVLIDSSRRIPSSFGSMKFPDTYLIDRKGRIRYRALDSRDWSSTAAMACVEKLF